MTTGLSVLTLKAAVRRAIFEDGNITRHPESHYLDFVVDAKPLRALVPEATGLVTPLNRAWLPTVAGAVKELIGERPTEGLAEERISLLVCGVCGGLGCGTLTATLSMNDRAVTWSDLG